MAIKFIAQDQLPAFLSYLAEKAQVVTPTKEDGVVTFRPWSPGQEVELEVLLAKQSPKEFVFWQTETYLKFNYRMEAPADADSSEAEAGSSGA
ncbi:MAG: hypothetical protein H5T84_06450, partial [Thermoleophilia bacterium]|nr:hypothetical protein [Thermoleophilia bacterium]